MGHCRQAFLEFTSLQAATAIKHQLDSDAASGQAGRKHAVNYTNPHQNPFRTLPKDAPARKDDRNQRQGFNQGGNPNMNYGGANNMGSGFRGGRGGFNRGGMNNMGGYNNNRNFSGGPMGGFQGGNMGGGGFQAPMGGMQNYGGGGFNNRGNMMGGGGMRGGGMRGGRGGGGMAPNMMGMGMGAMGGMGVNPMGGGMNPMMGNMGGNMGMPGIVLRLSGPQVFSLTSEPGQGFQSPNFNSGFGFPQNQVGGDGSWNPHGAKRTRQE